MRIKNTDNNFGIVSIFFHWAMAILIINLIIVGFYMSNMSVSLDKFKLYGMHKSFGILALILVSIRLLWRFFNSTPRLDLPLWEKLLARSAHFALYFFMFVQPISGWLMTSAAGFSPSFFGWIVLPNIISANEANFHLFLQVHQWVAIILISLIVLHTLASIKHHFMDKNNIVRRMLSWH